MAGLVMAAARRRARVEAAESFVTVYVGAGCIGRIAQRGRKVDLGTYPSRQAAADAISAAALLGPRPRPGGGHLVTMTKAEREDLQRLLRQRERVLISAAKERSAQLLADFENQMGQRYSFDTDEVWREAMKLARREGEKAQAAVAARCRELGIPARFAPRVDVEWYGRGENAFKQRRDELRKMAETRIAAIERSAKVEIENASLEAQTHLAIAGLSSEAAMAFVQKFPTIETLMLPLRFEEIAGEADPPVAEQLVSPNTLRQRRFRERQAALRNGSEGLSGPSRNAMGTNGEP
jgi:hypothetical protein